MKSDEKKKKVIRRDKGSDAQKIENSKQPHPFSNYF